MLDGMVLVVLFGREEARRAFGDGFQYSSISLEKIHGKSERNWF